MVALQFQRGTTHQGIHRKNNEDDSEGQLYEPLMCAGQEKKSQRDAEERREDEPGSAGKVDFLPVLDDDNGSDGNREENRERGGDLDGEAEGKQGHGDEGLSEAEG